MFVYEKKLQYPVKIKNTNPKLAAAIISQYGGPDGELGASLRYLSQRYSMPYAELKGLLTDIGTEELGHLEMVGTIVHQLTRNLNEEQIKAAGFDTYFVDHTTGVYPQFASGYPWSAATMQVTGDVIGDLTEDLAAEQKARVTYDNILRLSDDPDVSDVIKFLRAREIVHFQRFGEANRTKLKGKEPPDGGSFLLTNKTAMPEKPAKRDSCPPLTVVPAVQLIPPAPLPALYLHPFCRVIDRADRCQLIHQSFKIRILFLIFLLGQHTVRMAVGPNINRVQLLPDSRTRVPVHKRKEHLEILSHVVLGDFPLWINGEERFQAQHVTSTTHKASVEQDGEKQIFFLQASFLLLGPGCGAVLIAIAAQGADTLILRICPEKLHPSAYGIRFQLIVAVRPD